MKRVQKLDSISRLSWKQFLASIKRKFSEADDFDDDNEGEGDSNGDESSGRKRKAAAHTRRKDDDDVDNAAMSWTKLGAAAGRLFLSPVGLESMLGPISKPKVVKSTWTCIWSVSALRFSVRLGVFLCLSLIAR